MRALISRILLTLLVATCGITAAVILIPDLVSIGMIFLILPGLILAVTPTIFLYLATFAGAWFPLSRRNVPLGVAGGLAAVCLVAFSFPALANRWTDSRLKEAQAKEQPLRSPVKLAGVVALQGEDRLTAGCGDLCQTLLYDAGVERVLLLPTGKTSAVSYRVERQSNCPEIDRKEAQRNANSRWMKAEDTSRIAAATRLRIASGECLVSVPWLGQPNWFIEPVQEDFGPAVGHWSLLPGEVRAQGMQLKDDNRVVLRRSRLIARRFITPLHLTPRGGTELHMNGWEWGREQDRQSPVDTREFLASFMAPNQLPDVSDSDPEAIRKAVDAALDNPNASAAAFDVVDDYYRLFDANGKQKFRHEDAVRLARLIADPRVTSFWHAPVSNNVLASDLLLLRNPILDRMMVLALEQKWDSFRALDGLAGRLPEGAFATADPRVEAIVADPDLRRAAHHLVLRLADRGSSAAGQLASIATQPWGEKKSTKYRNPPGNPDDDHRAAIEGLCRLGPDARAVLPALRQAAANGTIPAGIQDGDRWRAMLVSLGLSSSEFELPRNRTWKIDLYRKDLEKQARACRQELR